MTNDDEPEAAPAPQARPAPVAATSSPPASADPELIRKIDERTTNQLQAPIEKVAGTYAEFMASMDALSDAVPDMAARQQAVIKLMTKKKIPLTQILSDLDACVGALEEEGRTFRKVSEDHLTKNIGGMKQESSSFDSSIAAKEAQVAAVQSEIAALRAKKASKESDIKNSESEAQLVQSRFSIIYGSIHSAMASQRKQISDLINKGTP